MRKLVIGMLLASAAVPAVAADLPLKAPARPVVYDWTGFYTGIHGGGGWSHDSFCEDPALFTVRGLGAFNICGINGHGAVFGGHFGYNWQYGGWVAGVEVDADWT